MRGILSALSDAAEERRRARREEETRRRRVEEKEKERRDGKSRHGTTSFSRTSALREIRDI